MPGAPIIDVAHGPRLVWILALHGLLRAYLCCCHGWQWAREMGNGKAHVVVVYDNPAHESRATMLAERVARRVLNPISTAFEFTVADASTAQQFFGFLKSPSQRFPVAIMASAGHGGVFVTEGKVC